MKRLNIQLALILFTLIVVIGVSVFFINKFQVQRRSRAWLDDFSRYLEADDLTKAREALTEFSRKNPDERIQSENYKLSKRMYEVDPSRESLGYYFQSLDNLIKEQPDDPKLRKEFLDLIYRFPDQLSTAQKQIESLKRLKAADDDVYLKEAMLNAAKGEDETAIKILNKIIGFNPETGKFDPAVSSKCKAYAAYGQLALIYAKQVSTRPFSDLILKELELSHPKQLEARLIAHQSWLDPTINNTINARRSIAVAKELAPEDEAVIRLAFESALRENQPDEAEKYARLYIEKRPTAPEGYLYLGGVLQRKGINRKQLMAVLDEGLAKSVGPGQLRLLRAKLEIILNTGDANMDEARELLARLRANPTFPTDVGQLLEAHILVRESKWSAAIELLKVASKTLIQQPDIQLANRLMGVSHEALGELDLATNLYRTFLTRDRTNLELRAMLARALLQSGKMDEARTEYELIAANMDPQRLIRIPELWQSLLNVRVMKQLTNQPDKRDWRAVDQLVAELKSLPDEALSGLEKVLVEAEILSRKGQHQAALDLIEPLRAIDPKNVRIWSKWSEIASRFQSTEQILAELDRAPPEVQNDSLIIMLRGNQLAIQGGAKGKDGLLKLLDSVKDKSKSEQLRMNMTVADALARMEEFAAAQTAAERALQLTVGMNPPELMPYPLLIRIAKDRRDINRLRELAAELRTLVKPDSHFALYADCQLNLASIRENQIKRQRPGDLFIVLDRNEKQWLQLAEQQANKLAQLRPDWVEVYKLRADIAGYKNDVPELINSLRLAAERGPLERYRMRQLAQLYYRTGLYKNARITLDQLFSEGDAALFKLNYQLMIQEGRQAEAAKLLDTFKLQDDAPIEEFIWQAQALSALGRNEEAEAVALKQLPRDPKIGMPQLWMLAVEILQKQKKLSAAEDILAQVSAAPASELQLLTAARIAETLGKSDLAIKLFPATVENYPDSLIARRELCGFYMRNKYDQLAVKALETLINICRTRPDEPQAEELGEWALRAKVITDTAGGNLSYEDFVKYDNDLKTSAEANPTEVNDLILRINLLSNRKEPSSIRKAIELLRDLEKRQELTIGDQLLLAQLYQRAGNWPETVKIMEPLSLSSKADPKMRVIYAEMLYENDEYRTAERYVESYVKETNDADTVNYLLGSIYVKQGRVREGLELLAKYLGKRPVPKESLGKLQRVALQVETLKQIDIAEGLYRELAENGPVGKILAARFQGRHRQLFDALKLLDDIMTEAPEQRFNCVATGVDLIQFRLAELKQPERQQAWAQLDRWYQRLYQDNPEDARLPSLLAGIRTIQGRPQEAVAEYQKALAAIRDQRSQDAGRMSNNLAYCIAQQGNPELFAEGFTAIENAIRIMGPQSDLLDTRGLLYLLSGEYQNARNDYLDAVLQPSAVKYYRLAYCNYKLNRDDDAKEAYRKARSLNFDPRELVPREQVLYQEFRAKYATDTATAAVK